MTWLLLSLLGCAPKYPSTPDPQARNELHQLFENHISALGGRTRFQSKTNILIKGRVRTMTSPESFSFKTIKVAPNKIWTTISNTRGEEASRRWDGTQGWNGDRLLTDEESSSLKRAADFYFPLEHNTQYLHAYEVRTTNFGGRPAKSVLAQTTSLEWQELFFDQHSNLLLGYSRWKKGEAKHWFRFGHYTNIDGVRHPLSIEEKSGSFHKVILIESIKWNVSTQDTPFPTIKEETP
jgi:hypothetical protein